MKKYLLFLLTCIAACSAPKHEPSTLRAPAYPLITIDPYTSGWSAADHLYDKNVTHWTGRDFPLIGSIKVDGTDYRFMGIGEDSTSTTATQILADVQATQTYYSFECGQIQLDIVFSAPLYNLKDLDLISRPINFISYSTIAKDGEKHEISLSITSSGNWAVNTPDQETESESFEYNGLTFIKTGSKSQEILGKQGDDVRIDWGYFYLVAPEAKAENMTLSVNGEQGHFLIGYDDIYSIQYHGENLRPYWNRKGDKKILDIFCEAEKDYNKDIRECIKFDAELMEECTKAGGRKYAELCALAYRQSIAAHKLVELPNGEIGFLSKENFSNGSIGTVDVTYPSSPLFLRYNPLLAEGLMNHIFEYSESGKWKKPFPAHDIGKYPIANGQLYGADMPVEESGNMVILTAATCTALNDFSYAKQHWGVLTEWTKYLIDFGGDPENQLCTDDFAGHFARNANLSAKAIMGIACYSYMANKLGFKDTSKQYLNQAKDMACKWLELNNNGDHYGLIFEKDSTWSQKYNLIWDKIFGFNIFPDDVYRKEINFYHSVSNKYGLPLDCRKSYTKSDWITWTASLAETKSEFESFINPMWDFYNETTDRVPMSDWYYTDSKKHVSFVARSVVGGYFIKLLDYTDR